MMPKKKLIYEEFYIPSGISARFRRQCFSPSALALAEYISENQNRSLTHPRQQPIPQ